MGARSGGSGSGFGSAADRALDREAAKAQKAWEKDFKARIGQPRTPIEKGSEAYKEAQKMANNIVFNANADSVKPDRYGRPDSLGWKDAADRVKFATDHVSKYGNDFEKSVAASVAKTIRPNGRGGKVAFVSSKQAWVLGKALSETHVKWGDFPMT